MLSKKEIEFLKELTKRDIPFMIVGLSAAVLQGAPVSTHDVDLWFKDLSNPEIAKAVQSAGGIYIPTMIMMQTPPRLAGKDFEFLDIVTHLHGLDDFEREYQHAITIEIEGISLKVLPLERIIQSKKAAGRLKDKAVLPALEAAFLMTKDK